MLGFHPRTHFIQMTFDDFGHAIEMYTQPPALQRRPFLTQSLSTRPRRLIDRSLPVERELQRFNRQRENPPQTLVWQ
jgi:hypothetical protein